MAEQNRPHRVAIANREKAKVAVGIAIVVVDVVVVVGAVVVGGADSKESEMYLAKRSSWPGSRTVQKNYWNCPGR